jgi:hypothetical protein
MNQVEIQNDNLGPTIDQTEDMPCCHKQTLFRYNSHLFVILYHFLTLLMLYNHHYH